MQFFNLRNTAAAILLAGTLGAGAISSSGSPNIAYTDWTSFSLGAPGNAIGSLTISNLNLTVTYSGEVATPTQASGGTDYWVPDAPFLGSVISNTPPTTDIIALVGGTTFLNTITFSEPVQDPIMLIVSLGQAGIQVNYDFDTPYDILSQGTGYWGPGSLFGLDSDVLGGIEGHGAIQFHGLISSISWTVPIAENWHGFTIGGISNADTNPVPEGRAWLGAMGLVVGVAAYRWWFRSASSRRLKA